MKTRIYAAPAVKGLNQETKVFYYIFEIIINVFVSSPSFIWLHSLYIISVRESVRQILTSAL